MAASSEAHHASLNDLSPRDFLPIKPLGHGDIGTVFLVQLCKNNQSYAMKVMQKEVLHRKGEKRAATEQKVLSMLSHPFLPTLYAHFQSEKHVSFIIDFCPGGDLNVLRQKQPCKRFSESITRFYAAEVVEALDYLHKHGIIYRDLKPENILIQSNGHIMLTDFDLSLVVNEEKSGGIMRRKHKKRSFGALLACFNPISITSGDVATDASSPELLGPIENRQVEEPASAKLQTVRSQKFYFPFSAGWPRKGVKVKLRKSASLSRSNSFVGTEEYVAPEVLWGKGHGFSVDWWTLGIFLYEMVYGKTPFKGPNRKETFYNILCREPEFNFHSPLNDLIKRLLVKDPGARLGSSDDAAEIKRHPYFKGTAWKHLNDVGRPPYVPPPPPCVHVESRSRHHHHNCTDELRVETHPASNGNSLIEGSHAIETPMVDYDDKENLQNTGYSTLRSSTIVLNQACLKPLVSEGGWKEQAEEGADTSCDRS